MPRHSVNTAIASGSEARKGPRGHLKLAITAAYRTTVEDREFERVALVYTRCAYQFLPARNGVKRDGAEY